MEQENQRRRGPKFIDDRKPEGQGHCERTHRDREREKTSKERDKRETKTRLNGSVGCGLSGSRCLEGRSARSVTATRTFGERLARVHLLVELLLQVSHVRAAKQLQLGTLQVRHLEHLLRGAQGNGRSRSMSTRILVEQKGVAALVSPQGR